MASESTSETIESDAESREPVRSTGSHSPRTAANGTITIFDDEELLHEIQPSWLTHSLTLWGVVLAPFTAFFSLFLLLIPYLRARNSWYVITNKRLVDIQGRLTGSSTVETTYDDITGDVRTSQGFLEGLLNKGTIIFEIERARGQSASETSFGEREGASREMNITRETIELSGIREYREVSNTIRRIQNA